MADVQDVQKAVEPEHSVLADQAEEQRAKMLRELAEQRERMRVTGVATAEADDSVGEPVEQELARLPEGAGEASDPNSSPTGAMVQDPDGRSTAEQRAQGQIP